MNKEYSFVIVLMIVISINEFCFYKIHIIIICYFVV